MAMMRKELISAVEALAPLSYAADWDNCGMQIDLENPQVEKVLIALEITTAVIDEAVEKGVDMILCHHPLIFHPVRTVEYGQVPGRHIIKLIQNGISVYSSHTSFDGAPGGNNDYIAEKIGLEQVQPLTMMVGDREVSAFGRRGVFPEAISFEEVGLRLQKTLNLNNPPRLVGNPRKMIQSVALCTGAGGREEMDAALFNGCDLFLTGDLRHHDALDALELGLCLADAGHYGTEAIFIENIAPRLRELTEGKVEILESQVNGDPFDTNKY